MVKLSEFKVKFFNSHYYSYGKNNIFINRSYLDVILKHFKGFEDKVEIYVVDNDVLVFKWVNISGNNIQLNTYFGNKPFKLWVDDKLCIDVTLKEAIKWLS